MAKLTIDWGAGFDVTESPADEFNIALDLSEVAAGGELAGFMDAPTVDATHSGSAHHAAVTLGAGSDAALALSGQELTLADVLTPTEHTAIGDSSPHHARAHAMDGSSDHSAATLGNVPYGGAAGAWTLLAGNTTATKNFLTQTGNGAVSAAPAWGTVADADVPSSHSGSTHAATQAAAEATAAAALTTHEGAADPHAGYRLESADHSHASAGAQGGQLTVAALSDAPGGELGGTWVTPTVDATHSGSAHHAILTLGDTLHTLVAQALSGVAAGLAQVGHVELATTAEIDAGTDTTRAIPVDQFVASARNVRWPMIRCLAAATAHTVSTTVGGDWESPIAGTMINVYANVDTAGVTGVATIDIHKNGVTILSTKITIDSSEKTSRTAVTAPVISVTAVAVGDIFTIDIDGIQTTAALGLTVTLGIRES